ncbi:hypothetical protein IQ238_01780 [Pleurocapsales cyanobacterium LEGE 06147]|nr:hypothetical protein [Pleurocapsales cyanobacterium LEGE 06147]
MKTRWKKTLIEITVWVIAEILLNLLGLDNLADYSEFIFKYEVTTINHILEPTIATTAKSSFKRYFVVSLTETINI